MKFATGAGLIVPRTWFDIRRSFQISPWRNNAGKTLNQVLFCGEGYTTNKTITRYRPFVLITSPKFPPVITGDNVIIFDRTCSIGETQVIPECSDMLVKASSLINDLGLEETEVVNGIPLFCRYLICSQTL